MQKPCIDRLGAIGRDKGSRGICRDGTSASQPFCSGPGPSGSVTRVARALLGPLKWIAGALCAFLFLRTLRGTHVARIGELLSGAGPWVLLAVAPFAVAQGLDTEAWRRVLGRLGPKVSLLALYPVRVALEAMTDSLPAGVIVAETVTPRLLAHSFGLAPSQTVAAAGARRWLTMRAHAVYVTLGALAGFVTVRAHPEATSRLRFGPLIVLLSALLPLGASFALSSALGRGSWATHLYRLAFRVRLPAVQEWLARRREAFVATDAGFAALAQRESLRGPMSLLVLAWLLESVEAFVLLRLAGASLTPLEVLSFEAGLSVLRSAWFFAPAGLGAQDLGYLAVLHALGVPDANAVGAAFLILKRGRELLWVALGYGWMLASQGSLRGLAPSGKSVPAVAAAIIPAASAHPPPLG
jgi:glycosyltransferase 2 family protein